MVIEGLSLGHVHMCVCLNRAQTSDPKIKLCRPCSAPTALTGTLGEVFIF